jgi:hypothetical protein
MSDRRAADHKYSVSEGGRARRRKADAKYLQTENGKSRRLRKATRGNAKHRLGRDGEPITAKEWDALLVEVSHQCFVCRRDGVKLVADHDHDNGYVRAPICSDDNLIEGCLKKMGIVTYDQVMQWASRMAALRFMPGLAITGEDELL